MGSEEERAPEAPRLTVALPEGHLKREVLAALEEAGVAVESLSPDDAGSVRDALRRASSDIVVLRRKQLDDETLALLRDEPDEIPFEILIVSEGESESERAELVSAGAVHVLDAKRPPGELASELDTVARSIAADDEGPGESDPTLADFLSRSPGMRRFLDLVRRVSDSDSSLLISGETGVGKERLARAIHAESGRESGPFVAVNCAALPESLIESELFGHEKGAFTDANRARQGHFEAANGGTIFLDEIGETPQHVQVKLLNVLQRREIQRLGAEQPTAIDVRVMAATNRDVEEEVRAGRFREDLYYRLSVVPIHVPPLRERPEDVPYLVGNLLWHFRQTMVDKTATKIRDDAMAALQSYAWPGNVRELINVVERAMLLTDGDEVTLDALPPRIVSGDVASVAERTPACTNAMPAEWRGLTIKEVRERASLAAEQAYLHALLTETKGHLGRTAELAGISPRALYGRLRLHALDKDDYKERER